MKYCHPNDAAIENDKRENTAGERLLYNSDEDLLFAFPPDWTDDQVMKALDFANEAFEKGIRYGRSEVAFEIRKALGMTS